MIRTRAVVCLAFLTLARLLNGAEPSGQKANELLKQIDQAQKRGDLKNAVGLAEQLVHYADVSFGKDHPDTAMWLNKLGGIYLDIGDFANADSVLRRALTIRQTIFGRAHRYTIETASNLASV